MKKSHGWAGVSNQAHIGFPANSKKLNQLQEMHTQTQRKRIEELKTLSRDQFYQLYRLYLNKYNSRNRSPADEETMFCYWQAESEHFYEK